MWLFKYDERNQESFSYPSPKLHQSIGSSILMRSSRALTYIYDDVDDVKNILIKNILPSVKPKAFYRERPQFGTGGWIKVHKIYIIKIYFSTISLYLFDINIDLVKSLKSYFWKYWLAKILMDPFFCHLSFKKKTYLLGINLI